MIRTRIAPSPTGMFHIGTLRTALFNYLFTKKNNGQFILRIEDTDKERSTLEYEENIVNGFKKMGIVFDESPELGGEYGPYRQSERTGTYKKYIQQLLDSGDAYYCYCTKEELDKEREECQKKKLPPRYSGKCRNISDEEVAIKKNPNPVIRLRVPENLDVEFYDLIRGNQKQNTKDLTGDFVIAKNLDTPLYNLTVVIDDYLMKITHVMRGEDHISNTPKQILIYDALGLEIPKFAHFPLILNPDKTKLSKRKNPVSVEDYLDKGYLIEGLINFLALLGWNPGTEKEIFTLDELINAFSIEGINKSGAVFDIDRLDWVNSEHIKRMDINEFTKACIPYIEKANLIKNYNGNNFEIIETGEVLPIEVLEQLLSHEQKRLKKLSDITENIIFFFTDILSYDVSLLCGKKLSEDQAKFALEESLKLINQDIDFNEGNLRDKFIGLIQSLNIKNGELLWPLRAALTGQDRSPGAFEVAAVLDKERTIVRIEKALEKLK